MSWLQTLQAQPWFSDVSAEFSQLAPDVPTYMWQGTILSEDSSLNPAQQNSGGAPYYGLFQEGVSFPTTVGLPAATVEQLKTPEWNAYYAALAMEQALKNVPHGASLETMVIALEKAGWPGAVSSDETATRVANVNQVITAQGGSIASSYPPGSIPGIISGGNLAGVIPGIGALIQGKGWDAANKAAESANAAAKAANAGIGGDIQAAAAQLGQSLLIGGIIIAGITGGFLLLANSMKSDGGGGGGMPVPVPI